MGSLDCCFRMRTSDPVFLALSLLILTEWAVSASQDDGLCMTENSTVSDGVMYEGECRDLYEAGVCALGERLFLRNGTATAQCDCDEGWLRHEGRCYQEFTPAFCEGDDKVLNLGTRKRLKNGQTFSCVRNPCRRTPHTLAHRLSWKNRLCHDVSGIEDVSQCDLYPSNPDAPGSEMKCCSPDDRYFCSRSNVLNPASSTSGPASCKNGQIWSRFRKACLWLIKKSEREEE